MGGAPRKTMSPGLNDNSLCSLGPRPPRPPPPTTRPFLPVEHSMGDPAVATNSLLSLRNLLQATCGALGSAISITVLYPLETVRTRLQVDRDLTPRSSLPLIVSISRNEGIAALYRGWASLVLGLSLTNFCYFYSFHGLRAMQWGDASKDDNASAGTDLVCAAFAGVVAVLITNPFWVVNTRLKLQDVPRKDKAEVKERRYSSVSACLVGVTKSEGLSALWSGTSSSLLLVSNPSIQFVCYEALKRSPLAVLRGHKINPHLQHLFNGALSKLIATIATYPLQLIQTNKRAGRFSTSNSQIKRRSSFLSIVDQVSSIVQKDGALGLFRGLESKLTQTVLSAALMFFIYEELATAVFAFAGVQR